MSKYGYVIVIGKKGNRHMMYPHQSTSVYKSKRKANKRIKNLLKNNSKETLRMIEFVNPKVRRISLYETGDPRRTRFK